MGLSKLDNACASTDCDNKLADTVGEVAHQCYKTKVCKADKDTLSELSLTGTVWYPDLYQQQLDNDDSLYRLDSYVSPVHQNYLKLVKYPLVLNGSIEPTIDPESRLVTATGSGRFPGLVRIHVGDVIVGPIGDKRYIFTITSAVPTSLSDKAWYNVEFTLTGEAVNTNQDFNVLENKTVDTLTFDSQYGLISPKDAEGRKDIMPYLKSALKEYLRRFKDPFSGFLTLSKGGKPVIDLEMQKFISSFANSCGTGQISTFEYTRKGGTILLDVMMSRGLANITTLCPFRCLTNVNLLPLNDAASVTIYGYSNWIVGRDYTQPLATRTSPCPDYYAGEGGSQTDQDLNDCWGLDPPCCGCSEDPLNDVNSNYGRTIETDDGTIPIIKDPFVDKYYILSEAFYKDDLANMSYLEKQVRKYLRNEPVTVADLLPLFKDLIYWCSHSWFYYLPLLLMLGKYALTINKCKEPV